MTTEATPLIPDSNIENAVERARLLELENSKAVDYDWGAIKWICDRKITPDSLESFGYAYVLPGKTNPEHRHRTCEEIIYMLAGELKLYSHGECLTLKPGQTALIPPGVRHAVVNEGWEPALYIASFSAAFRDTVFKGTTGKLDLEAFEKLR
jgi:quercetin dioxygenase-like cupin family protein